MIPGPLGFRFGETGRRFPRIEMGEIAGNDLPTRHRARVWLEIAPRIGEHIVIKLHTHGAPERNSTPLLNGGLDELFTSIEAECKEAGLILHYATAWELFQTVSGLIHGGEPSIH